MGLSAVDEAELCVAGRVASGRAERGLDLNEGHLPEKVSAHDWMSGQERRFEQVASIRRRVSADGSVEWFASLRTIDRERTAPPPPGFAPSIPRERLRTETAAERAGRRAKRAVRERVLAMKADRLVTITYRGAMTDFARLLRDFQSLLDRLRYAGHVFEYVAVPERHKSGGWHIHMAVAGRQDYRLLRSCWWRVVGEGMGNVDVKNPFGRNPRRHQLALYLAKYVGKTLEASEVADGRKRYWSTRGIPQPESSRDEVDAFDLTHLIEMVYAEALERGLCAPVFWCSADAGPASGGTFWMIASPP